MAHGSRFVSFASHPEPPVVNLVDPPTLQQLATAGIGLRHDQVPPDGAPLAEAVLAEAIRLAAYQMFHEFGDPVHPIQLRTWVRHKTAAILPGLFEPEAENRGYRGLLEDGGEFLGDVIVVDEGRLCPAPTRVIPLGLDHYALVSGTPTRFLGSLTAKIKLHSFSRQLALEGNPLDQGLRTQTLPSYLGLDTETMSPKSLIERYAGQTPRAWARERTWERYVPNNPARSVFGFQWKNEDAPRARSSWHELHREPLSEQAYRYWLRISPREMVHVEGRDWKRVALALDLGAGVPRTCTLHPGGTPGHIQVTLPVHPYEALFRLLRITGATRVRSRAGQTWELPARHAESLLALLKGAGFEIRNFGAKYP